MTVLHTTLNMTLVQRVEALLAMQQIRPPTRFPPLLSAVVVGLPLVDSHPQQEEKVLFGVDGMGWDGAHTKLYLCLFHVISRNKFSWNL